MRNDCHFRLLAYSTLSGIPPNSGETGAYISTFCIRCFANQFTLHLLTFLFCFHFNIEQQQKLTSFFTLKKIAVEPEKLEDRLDEDGSEAGELRNLFNDVCCSRFQYYKSLTQTIFEMTQLKMPCGTMTHFDYNF